MKNCPKKVAVVLSGCGVFDGTEIYEVAMAVLNIEKCGALPEFFAPENLQLAHVINHAKGEIEEGCKRKVFEESARIARGNINALSLLKPENFDAIIFPGGFGAAKNLSSFAFEGANCVVNDEISTIIKAAVEAKVKMGFICISPVIAAKVISNGVQLTVGLGGEAAEAVNKMGARAIDCNAENFVKDETLPVYSTPAFMATQSVAEIEKGIGKMISAMLD